MNSLFSATDQPDVEMLNQLKVRARALKKEAYAMYLAARDPRTPWYAKALIFFVVAHTFSPIDLIPDFIPVLGYLDDLIITPGGIWLAVRLIPSEVMTEARAAAATLNVDRSIGKIGAFIIMLLWIIAASAVIYFFIRFTKRI
jgi:uncharacterized membrane protein YkvA (DUF1232 family)